MIFFFYYVIIITQAADILDINTMHSTCLVIGELSFSFMVLSTIRFSENFNDHKPSICIPKIFFKFYLFLKLQDWTNNLFLTDAVIFFLLYMAI